MTMTESTSDTGVTESLERFELPEDALEWCKRQVAKARNDRIPFERQWYLNLAFFAGRQWIQWTGDSGNFDFARLHEPPKRKHNARLTSNKIRTRMLRTIAKLNQERPRSFVQPSTSDDDDIAGSRAAEKIHEWVTTEQLELDDIMQQVDFWTVLCGTGFVKDRWDNDAVDAAGQPGCIEIDSMSPFHVFVPDLEVQSIEKQPWIAHVCSKSVEDIKNIFDVVLEATVTGGSGSILNDKFLHSVGINSNTAKDSVIYYEMYIKPQGPRGRFPDGVLICWANDTLLQVIPGKGEELPLDPETGEPSQKVSSPFINGTEYPITRRIHYPSGKFYGESPVTDMISLQQEYNRARSQMIENRNLMSNPPWLAVQGSIINPRALDGAPGRLIQYAPVAQPPQPVQMPGLPATVAQDIQMLAMDLDELSQNSEISKGGAPGRVEAATAIAYLQEESDQIISLASRNKEIALEKLGRHILYYVNTYWTAERSFTVVGRNAAFEAQVFSAASTHGSVNFKIVPGSGAPLSRSAKQALIMELIKMGAIPVGKGLQYLAMGDAAKLYEEMQIDTAQAERENVQLSKGLEIEVLPLYNHIQHIQSHDDAVKRQEFKTLPEEIQMLHNFHTYTHLQILATLNGVPLMVDPAEMQMESMIHQGIDPNTGESLIQLDPFTGQPGEIPPQMKYYISATVELELRRIYNLIVANGGVAPQPGSGVSSESGGEASPIG